MKVLFSALPKNLGNR